MNSKLDMRAVEQRARALRREAIAEMTRAGLHALRLQTDRLLGITKRLHAFHALRKEPL